MTDEFEKINFDEMFEQILVRDQMQNPTPERAAELLELAAAHKTNSLSYEMTEELRQYLIDCAQEYAQGTSVEKAFGTAKRMGRPSQEQKHISMNAHTWGIVLKGEKVLYALEETADVFNTTYDTTKFAWERKNHDMGEREMCRVGLDVFLVMNNRKLTPEEEKIATKYLKEEVSVSAIKKHNHIRKKYKERYKLKPVKRTVADESFDEFDSNSTDG